jgi:hypothetical protein
MKPFVVKCKAKDLNKKIKELKEQIDQDLEDNGADEFLRMRL